MTFVIVCLTGFVLVNFSLFLSNYLINFRDSTFLPDIDWRLILRTKSVAGNSLFISNNSDVFRISVDVSALIILVHATGSALVIKVTILYYGFIQVYNLYHCAFRKIYQTHPVFISDWKLMMTGAGFLWGESKIKFIGASVVIVAMIASLSYSFGLYLVYISSYSPDLWLIGAWGLFMLFYSLHTLKRKEGVYDIVCDLGYRVALFPMRVFMNFKLSLELHNSRSILSELLTKNEHLKAELVRKPDVYLIFVESYGGLLLKDEELNESFKKIWRQFEKGLGEDGYTSRSNLSHSVSLVGPSWLAYTTGLLGMKVASNYLYEHILSHPSAKEINTFCKFFQNNGYKSFHLNPTQPRFGIKVPYKKIEQLYGIDQYVLIKDIPYAGKVYGISQSAPDQYVLNYTREAYMSQEEGPSLLFYLTKNSHSPFLSPELPVADWKSLNELSPEIVGSEFLRTPNKENYIKAINYQLKTLEDFIRKDPKQDSIYLIIGDHQPHHIVHKTESGTETLFHVVSKDKDLVQSFEKYGFKRDLDQLDSPVNHEDLFPMFAEQMRVWYGQNESD